MADENYVPFGPEWEKEVSKNSKKDIIAMYREVAMDRVKLQAIARKFIFEEENGFTDFQIKYWAITFKQAMELPDPTNT